MKKVTSADTVVMANHYKNILEAEGIPCQIRNEHLNQIYGEMPFTEVWPEIWVLKDIDYDRAKQLIDAAIIDCAPDAIVAVDAQGYIYVVDTATHRVMKFAPLGQ